MEDDRDTGARLRTLRTSAGVTLREFAESINLSPAYISDLELGKRAWNARREGHYDRFQKR